MDGSGKGVDTHAESRSLEVQDLAHLFNRRKPAIVKTVTPRRLDVVFDQPLAKDDR